jgi:hypothetical protein
MKRNLKLTWKLVPEPSTGVLFCIGLLAAACFRRRANLSTDARQPHTTITGQRQNKLRADTRCQVPNDDSVLGAFLRCNVTRSTTISATAVVLLCSASALHASTISTLPAFAARTEDQTTNSRYTIGQKFIATPGTVSLSSFTFYLRSDQPQTEPYPFVLYELDEREWPYSSRHYQSLIFSGLTTSTPYIEPPRPGVSTGFMQVTMQTGALPLTPGRSYLAALRADSLYTLILGNVGDIYPGGGSYSFKTTGSILNVSNVDLAFTAEFVGGEDQIYGPVPEPATLAMLGLAILAVGGYARRRNSVRVAKSTPASRKPDQPTRNLAKRK